MHPHNAQHNRYALGNRNHDGCLFPVRRMRRDRCVLSSFLWNRTDLYIHQRLRPSRAYPYTHGRVEAKGLVNHRKTVRPFYDRRIHLVQLGGNMWGCKCVQELHPLGRVRECLRIACLEPRDVQQVVRLQTPEYSRWSRVLFQR